VKWRVTFVTEVIAECESAAYTAAHEVIEGFGTGANVDAQVSEKYEPLDEEAAPGV
jgi:hypothetical protein